MSRVSIVFLSFVFLGGCDGGALVMGLGQTPAGEGPRIVWDLSAEPLPEIPLPNDIATWPDPTAPTGRRVNASLVAPTSLEADVRVGFDRLDGWGAFAPITVRFEGPIDTDALALRQGGARFSRDDWSRHAVYLVNLTTGLPVPLDVGSGSTPLALPRLGQYWPNDPRSEEPTLLYETIDEDRDGDGFLDLGEDTDADGILDRANTPTGEGFGAGLGTVRRDAADERALVDAVTTFYEHQTDTLVLRPLLPLDEATEYAVVLTDRLVDDAGAPVRSPFPFVHHISQRESLLSLPERLAAHPVLYGDLANGGFEHVAFAWTFTTQSITGDLEALREGLYGRGAFAHLAERFPPDLSLVPLRGGRSCEQSSSPYTVRFEELGPLLEMAGTAVISIVNEEQIDALLESHARNVSHYAVGIYETPYLLGDPDVLDTREQWEVDRVRGEARVGRARVPVLITVPRETEEHHQPFPTLIYNHGFGSVHLESLAFSGILAEHGVATVAIMAHGHGLGVNEGLVTLIESALGAECLGGLARALFYGRARDLNGDGLADNGGDLWTPRLFHSRDALRQTALDGIQAVRILRHFADVPGVAEPRRYVPKGLVYGDGDEAFTGDVDGDGDVDRAGDLDGDGVPDLGGFHAAYGAWGQSLGALHTALLAGAEPAIAAAVPTSGAGGLADVGLRTDQGAVRGSLMLSLLGPLVVSQTSSGPSETTACADGQRSMRFVLPEVAEEVSVEFACLPPETLEEGDVVEVYNLRKRLRRCAVAGSGGRVRVPFPADTDDPLAVTVYDGGAPRVSLGERCDWPEGTPPVAVQIEYWSVANGRGDNACERCASYRGRTFELGESLVSPTEGLGFVRQSPDFRRFIGLAQLALEAADPIHYARRFAVAPAPVEDVANGEPRYRGLLVLNTAGDPTVPIAGGVSLARAAGLVPFMPANAPEVFADYRAPADFEARYGFASPHEMLRAHHVIEGVSRLQRTPVPLAPNFLFDVDDLSEGKQWFTLDGQRQLPPGGVEPVARPERADPPLRWVRANRPAADMPTDAVWAPTVDEGMSGVLSAMFSPLGEHAIYPADPARLWDHSLYVTNLVGWYFASGGRELLYHTDPENHHCLEAGTCAFGAPP